jgi:hypothetical protein
VGQQKQTVKALINNNIEAFLFIITETFPNKKLFICYVPGSLKVRNVGFQGEYQVKQSQLAVSYYEYLAGETYEL